MTQYLPVNGVCHLLFEELRGPAPGHGKPVKVRVSRPASTVG